MKLPPLEYACPTTLSEAVALLASRDGDAKAIAGGQSLMPMMAFRIATPRCWSISASSRAARHQDFRRRRAARCPGALARHLDDKRLATAHPLLQAAVAHVAHYQIRNRGTVGGSVAHADPAAEMPASS